MLAAARLLPNATTAWTPTSLPSLAGWWDASDSATITQSAGAVSQWNDKSGNARHATASGTAKPTTGTRTQNGLNVLDFDGTDDLISVSFTLSQPFTVLIVAASDITTGIGHIYNGGNSLLAGNNGTPNKWHAYALAGVTGGNVDTSAHGFVAIFNGASSELRVDGSSTTGNAGTGNTIRFRVSHTSQFLNGWVGEAAIVAAALGSSDVSAWESYVRTKWGTP